MEPKDSHCKTISLTGKIQDNKMEVTDQSVCNGGEEL